MRLLIGMLVAVAVAGCAPTPRYQESATSRALDPSRGIDWKVLEETCRQHGGTWMSSSNGFSCMRNGEELWWGLNK